MEIKKQKILYHLTHIDNLESIMENGLLSRNDALKLNQSFVDVADPDILKKRKLNRLDDYVLFHFYPNSAFDTAVKEKFGSENFVYIAIYKEFAKDNGFKVIPIHPLHGDFEIYDYEEGFEKINWELFEKKMQDISPLQRTDARLTKMAECISIDRVNPDSFFCIYCHDSKVEELKKKYSSICYINSGVWLRND